MPILITGATGNNGRDIVRELRAMGAGVRAMVRDPAKGAALGVDLVRGGFDDPASLEAAMRGCERVLILVPVDERMAQFADSAIAAARRAGVGHIVYFSAVGASPRGASFFTRSHGAAEEALKQSGAAYTILRPNFFMQNLFASAPTIKSQGAIYNVMGDGKAAHVDTRDIAAVAARVLAEGTHRGRTLGITGPDAVSFDQVAATAARVLGRPVKYVNVPREAFISTLISAGVPAWQARAIVDLDSAVISGEAGRVEQTVRSVTGREPRTLERFFQENAAAFAA